MEEIPVELNKVLGSVVTIYVSVKPKSDGSGEFRNIYINKLKGKLDAGVKPAPAVIRTPEPMDNSNAQRLNSVAKNATEPSQDPFGGVFDGECEPPF